MSKSFRILHTSDLHIGAKPDQPGFPASFQQPLLLETHGKAQLEALKNAIKSEDFDAVLITGDVACDGSEENQGAARKAFDALVALKPNLPFAVMPGNHDRYGPDMAPGGRVFDQHFGTWWTAGEKRMQVLLALPSLASPTVVVLGADFSLPAGDLGDTNLGNLGEGRVLTVVTDALEAETKAWQAKGVAVAWASHFPPRFPDEVDGPICVDPPNVSSQIKLLQPDFLIKAAIRAGVKHLFCGHTHRQRWYQRGPKKELTVFCTASTLSCAERQNWFQWLDLTPTGAGLAVDWHPVRFNVNAFDAHFPRP
jgi:3',5'-cyclic AMP phosphodiesterase CpdA